MQRTLRTAVAVTTALTLSVAPAALARPAADPGAADHLTPAQLRAINGHQPADPLPPYPDVTEPLAATDDGSGFPWVLVAVPVGLGVAAGAARISTRRLRIRPRHTVRRA